MSYLTPEIKFDYSSIGKDNISYYKKIESDMQTQDYKIIEAKNKRNEIENIINDISIKFEDLDNDAFKIDKEQLNQLKQEYYDYLSNLKDQLNDLEIITEIKIQFEHKFSILKANVQLRKDLINFINTNYKNEEYIQKAKEAKTCEELTRIKQTLVMS